MAETNTEERTEAQQARLAEILRDVKEIRPLPAVALRVLAMSEDDRFSAQQLAELIRVDQALTVRTLRLSNSSFYGMPRRITTLRDAIVLLGMREVRSLAIASCVVDVSIAPREEFDYAQFWVNSFAVATLAAVLSEAFDCEPDDAFTAGIVQNVGRLALAQFRPKWLQASVAIARHSRRPLQDVQMELFGFSDSEIGGTIARHWQFPEPLCMAVERHAGPRHEDDVVGAPLTAVVRRAWRFAQASRIGDGLEEPQRMPVEMDWSHPQVQQGLRAAGGVSGILRRAAEFVETSDGALPVGQAAGASSGSLRRRR